MITSVNSDFYAKIGVSSHPKKRLVEIQTGCPLHIQSVYTSEFKSRSRAFAAEASAHSKLSGFRTCGEWFVLRGPALERMFKTVESVISQMRGRHMERIYW
jgi:hypothetical protein